MHTTDLHHRPLRAMLLHRHLLEDTPLVLGIHTPRLPLKKWIRQDSLLVAGKALWQRSWRGKLRKWWLPWYRLQLSELLRFMARGVTLPSQSLLPQRPSPTCKWEGSSKRSSRPPMCWLLAQINSYWRNRIEHLSRGHGERS